MPESLDELLRETKFERLVRETLELHGWSATSTSNPVEILLMLELDNDLNDLDDEMENDND